MHEKNGVNSKELFGSYQETNTGSVQGKTFKLSDLSKGCPGLGVEVGCELHETADDEASTKRPWLQTPRINWVRTGQLQSFPPILKSYCLLPLGVPFSQPIAQVVIFNLGHEMVSLEVFLFH